MTRSACEAISFEALVDYASGESTASEPAWEAHLFTCQDCGRRASAVDELLAAIGPAVRTATVGGFVTDAVLNRLAREGIRVRTFTLTPGETVPCAVWQDDELMALRLRGDFGSGGEITLTERVDGVDLIRASGEVGAGASGEVIHVIPAAVVRQLPVVDVQLTLTAGEASGPRVVGTYRLAHGGSLQR